MASAAGAIAGVGIGALLGGAVKAASNLNETVNKTNVIFGQNTREVRGWAQGSARNFGLSEQAALAAASQFGNMLTQLGYTADAAVEASTSTVKLAADLGSFNNLDTGDVLDRIGAAMRGEYDSLQLLIPNINAARVEQEALAATGKTTASALTAQEKATATLAIIQRDGAAAANDFAETSDGLANSQKILNAEWQDAQARLGALLVGPMTGVVKLLTNGVIPAFEAVVGVVGGAVDVISDVPTPVLAAAGAMGSFVLLRGPLTSLFETVALKALYFRDSLGSVSAAAGTVRSGAGRLLSFLGGPWGLAIGGAVVGLGYLVQSLFSADDATDAATSAQRSFADALRESKGVIDETVRAQAAKAALDADLLDLADAAGIRLGRVTDAVLGNEAAYRQVTSALDDYLQARLDAVNGNTEDAGFVAASDAVAQYKANLDELAPTVSQTAQEQRQLAEATTGTGAASTSATGSVQDYAAELEASAEAAGEAKRQTDSFKLSLDILTGAGVSMIEVQASLEAALSSATDALDEMGGSVLDAAGSLNLQSENGRAAADVLLDVRNAGNELIATMISQGATADAVRQADAELRASFLRTASQMGISEAAALALADQILGIPAERETTIMADTDQATSAINALQAGINNLKGRTVNIQAVLTQTGGMVGNIRNMTPALAAGGPIFGPGTETSDSIPALLSNGEHVLTAREVRAAGGHSAVKAWRRSLVQQFAGGGPVGISALFDSSRYEAEANAAANALGRTVAAAVTRTGVAGSGSVGGSWASLWNFVKARVPLARINSTFRPGDPGYHGRNKAIDFGYGSGPGGMGSAGLALINRVLHDGVGRNLAELIYDGIGDDRPDLKNGRPLTYSASTRAQHRNHVHAAVYDQGGLLPPGLTLAYNGTGRNETVVPAEANKGGRTEIVVTANTADERRIAQAIAEEHRRREVLGSPW